MIYRFNVQHIHKRKNKQTTVTAKDPKQAMRCVIHKEHGEIPEYVVWEKDYLYDNVIESGYYKIGNKDYCVCIAYIPSNYEELKQKVGGFK